MDAETLAELLPDVKAYIQVPWDDEATDARLTEMIRASAAYLDKKRGEPADYTSAGLPRELLFERVRYARDGALDVFAQNYRAEILDMQHERMVSAYAAENAVSASGQV